MQAIIFGAMFVAWSVAVLLPATSQFTRASSDPSVPNDREQIETLKGFRRWLTMLA
jgi:hypothetical protein